MAGKLYASFADSAQAEKAAGALLDYGARKEDLSIVANNPDYNNANSDDSEASENSAKHGFSTTTPKDAGVGAAKGAGIGVGVCILAGLASLFIPGVGLVIGGGALATAIGGAVGTTAAGAVAGGVTGYLKDQGVPEDVSASYAANLEKGGAILELALPSGKVDEAEGRSLIAKYDGADAGIY